MTILWGKVKEVLLSVIPIVLIVLVLHFTIAPLPTNLLIAFLLGAVLVVLGLTVFLFGIEEGLEPIGQFAGRAITHTGSYPIVITASLILGFFISFAEPDLHILAKQVDAVTSGLLNRWILVISVSIGIGVMMTVSMLRILHTIRVRYIFAGAYGLILFLSLFSSGDFMAIARNAGAKGGTILHGRGTGAQVSEKLFGMEIEPEKELLLILAPEDVANSVILALEEALSLDHPGTGILYVESVSEVRGLVLE